MKNEITRKEFLKQISLMGTTALAAGLILSACGSSEKKAEGEAETKAPEDPCSDLSGLTEDEKAVRDEFEYVAETPIPEERCDNCALWIEPEPGSECGGCQIMAGPIHPGGYCTAWVAME